MAKRQPSLLILSQVFWPDAAAVGQYMTSAAIEMARRGWRVRVLTSGCGYNDPTVKYRRREYHCGVEIVRLPLSSFGKRRFLIRALAAALFMLQTILRALVMRRFDVLLVSTSPPMCIVAALAIRYFRRTAVKFWVMDINPDQLIALGHIKPTSFLAHAMNACNVMILRRAANSIVLDRYMAETMNRKLHTPVRLAVLPPWPLEAHIESIPRDQNPFRKLHHIEDKFVFMYSGNHGLALPLDTFLQAALRFKDDPRLAFVFVGEGVRKKEVDRIIRDRAMNNMLSLPYQPLEQLRYSLSAADVHLVTMDDRMVGIIHPCKVYGAMAVSRPVLYIGPRPSHVSDLIDEYHCGLHVNHGDVAGAAHAIESFAAMPLDQLVAMGRSGRQLLHGALREEVLRGQFCDVLESGVTSTPHTPSPATPSIPAS